MSPNKTRGWLPTGRDRMDYRVDGAPMLFLAFGLVNGGLSALFDPAAASNTSVARVLPDDAQLLELFWQVAYVTAGLLLMIGVLRPWPVMDVLGCWLAVWALFVNLLALLILRGPAGAGAAMGAFLFAIAVASVRIFAIHRRAALEDRRSQKPFPGPEKRR